MPLSFLLSIWKGTPSPDSTKSLPFDPPLGLKNLLHLPAPPPPMGLLPRRHREVEMADNNDVGEHREEEDVEVDEEEEEDEENECCCWGYYGPRHAGRRFPPPIPVLAKLEENSPRHMPRVLKRTYEAGGRLVIREMELQHHEFLRARRENGRLTLELVHINAEDVAERRQKEEDEDAPEEGSSVDDGLEESAVGTSGEDGCTCGREVERSTEKEDEKRRVVLSSSMPEVPVRKGCLQAGVMFRMATLPPVSLVRI